MWLIIESIEDGCVTNSGKEFDGITIQGRTKGSDAYPSVDKTVRMFDFAHGHLIPTVRETGIGGMVELTYQKGPKGQDLIGAKMLNQGTGVPNTSTPTQPPQQGAINRSETPVQGTSNQGAGGGISPVVMSCNTKSEALSAATKAVVSMATSDRSYYKKTAKTDLIITDILDTAGKFEQYLEGKLDTTVASNTEGLKSGSVELEQPDIPVIPDGGDGDGEDSDTPFD